LNGVFGEGRAVSDGVEETGGVGVGEVVTSDIGCDEVVGLLDQESVDAAIEDDGSNGVFVGDGDESLDFDEEVLRQVTVREAWFEGRWHLVDGNS